MQKTGADWIEHCKLYISAEPKPESKSKLKSVYWSYRIE